MWDVQKPQVYDNWLNPEPVRVLYEFDGPRIFICEDARCRDYLAYHCGEGNGLWRFLVVPFSQYLQNALVTGQIDLRTALVRDPAWIFDLDKDWKTARAWEVKVKDLPARVLPKPGVMIYRHLPRRITPAMAGSGASNTVVKMMTTCSSGTWFARPAEAAHG